MTQEERLVEFVKNIEVDTPSNSQKHSATNLIANIPVCVKYLYKIIDSKTEPALDRFGYDFSVYIDNILNLDKFDSLPISIEGLGQKFESFLKIIAYLKGYHKTVYWKGDANSKGILGTSLQGLCWGLLENTSVGNQQKVKQLKLPDKLFKYSGTNKELVDFVREGIRNKVHYAQTYNRKQLIAYSEKVVLVYLLVIEDNFRTLSGLFSPEYHHLDRIVENSEYKNLDTVYVDLFGKDFSDIDIQGTRILDVKDILNDLERYNLYSDSDELDFETEEDTEIYGADGSTAPTNGTGITQNIVALANTGISFFIIGDPGAGKSTTLLKILFQNSKRILNGENLKIPVYLSAKAFSPSNSFVHLIKRNFGDNWSIESLKTGNYLLLIDGLNEVPKQLKNTAINQLKDLIHDYPLCNFIFSERKIGFERYFDISVYELKPLDNVQIEDFIRKYGKTNGEKIWGQISNNNQLMDLAHNPLMLKMILSISKSGDIPANKGRLYHLFIKTILTREEKKGNQINYDLKLDILSKVSYTLRKDGQVSCNKFYFKKLMRRALIENNSAVDLDRLYFELVENFIIKGETDDISFIHESYLEYFAGYALMSNFKVSGTLDLPVYNDNWLEPLELCVGLFDNESDVVNAISGLCYGISDNIKRDRKKLVDFDHTDLNSEIYIAAKVANNIKSYFPKAYLKVENLIGNYLTLWKYLLFEKGIEIIPADKLFRAVALLNSEKLYKVIFCNDEWVSLWLYSDIEQVTDENKKGKQLPYQNNELYNTISSALTANIVDISIIFQKLEDCLNQYGLFYSVARRIREMKSIIIENASYKNLRDYYISNKDVDVIVIRKLIKLNYTDVELYDFEKGRNDENRTVLRGLIRDYLDIESARNLLVNQLKTGRYTIKSKSFIKKLFKIFFLRGYEQDVIKVAEYVLDAWNNDSLDYYFEEILQKISWDTLSPQIQDYFLSKLTIFSDENEKKSQILDRGQNFEPSMLAQIVVHPSFLSTYSNVILYIVERLRIDSSLLTKFLCRNQLVNHFQAYIPASRLGIITSNSFEHNNCFVYIQENGTTTEFSYQNGIKVGDVVVLDESQRIHPLIFLPELKTRLGYVKGEIIKYDAIKSEGFISPTQKWVRGDCYFSKKSCSFLPTNGMMVEFIPVPNPIERYKGKSIALNISIVSDVTEN